MKAEYKYYLKTFLLISFGYGFVTILLDDLSLDKIIIKTVFYSVLISIIAILLNRKILKKLGAKSYLLEQSDTVKTRLDKETAFESIKDEMSDEISKVKESENTLLLKTGSSWTSWGEKINVNYLTDSNGRNKIEIISKPKVFLTIVDWGKNYKNVQKIKDIISPVL